MVHTLPDYTTKYKLTRVFGQIDSGELAARLGNIDTWDRRGNVIWYDDFESSTTKWYFSGTGTGWAVERSTDRAYTGAYSLKMTTGDASGNFAKTTKALENPTSETIGIEIIANSDHPDNELYLFIVGFDGNYQYSPAIKWNVGQGKVYYKDSTGTYQLLRSGIYAEPHLEYWLPLKLVWNWKTLKYVRAVVGEYEYDLSDEDIQKAVDTSEKHIEIWIYYMSTASGNKIGYVDNAILTQNEP